MESGMWILLISITVFNLGPSLYDLYDNHVLCHGSRIHHNMLLEAKNEQHLREMMKRPMIDYLLENMRVSFSSKMRPWRTISLKQALLEDELSFENYTNYVHMSNNAWDEGHEIIHYFTLLVVVFQFCLLYGLTWNTYPLTIGCSCLFLYFVTDFSKPLAIGLLQKVRGSLFSKYQFRETFILDSIGIIALLLKQPHSGGCDNHKLLLIPQKLRNLRKKINRILFGKPK